MFLWPAATVDYAGSSPEGGGSTGREMEAAAAGWACLAGGLHERVVKTCYCQSVEAAILQLANGSDLQLPVG